MVRLDFEPRKDGLVARVTLDNPKKLNIFTREAMAALVRAMREAELKDGLRAVVLTGAGDRAFVGGADLDALGSLDPASARAFISNTRPSMIDTTRPNANHATANHMYPISGSQTV